MKDLTRLSDKYIIEALQRDISVCLYKFISHPLELYIEMHRQ